MQIPVLDSIKKIERQYFTGEMPVQVMCSDMNAYICKYMRSSVSAFKLVCEFVGAYMADAWSLGVPDVALVNIKPSHWDGINISHVISAPTFGCKKMEGVVDITPSTYGDIEPTEIVLKQLLRIALFDFWIANEDRNPNNANLLYDVNKGNIVPIDFGCILNTATFDFPLSQLTVTDTILNSDLFYHLLKGQKTAIFDNEIQTLSRKYKSYIRECKNKQDSIINDLPKEWKVPSEIVSNKMQQLFDHHWIDDCWHNFLECIKDIRNEK